MVENGRENFTEGLALSETLENDTVLLIDRHGVNMPLTLKWDTARKADSKGKDQQNPDTHVIGVLLRSTNACVLFRISG
jgi:hypothetical protein